jgi:hypothetical protein
MACGALRNNVTVGGKRRRNRRNNMSMRKRKNNVSMRKRRNNMSMRKRRNNMTMRRNNMLRRMMYGGYESVPGSVNGNSMASMTAQSLAQGNQFAELHKNQHGGGNLDAGPFPGAVVAPSVLPENLHASARVAPLDAAIKEIQNLKDQSGGRRRRRRGSKKSKKATRKGRKGRKNYRGGAWSMENAQSVSAPGLILPPSLEAKALSGMNAEWKLAEDPKAFAPGYKTY